MHSARAAHKHRLTNPALVCTNKQPTLSNAACTHTNTTFHTTFTSTQPLCLQHCSSTAYALHPPHSLAHQPHHDYSPIPPQAPHLPHASSSAHTPSTPNDNDNDPYAFDDAGGWFDLLDNSDDDSDGYDSEDEQFQREVAELKKQVLDLLPQAARFAGGQLAPRLVAAVCGAIGYTWHLQRMS
jgi:hypothetical protein